MWALFTLRFVKNWLSGAGSLGRRGALLPTLRPIARQGAGEV